MTESLTGLPNFLVFFGIAICLTATYLLLYTLATAHNEFLLIRQGAAHTRSTERQGRRA